MPRLHFIGGLRRWRILAGGKPDARRFHLFFGLSLSARILGLIAVGIFLTAWIIVTRSEAALEAVLLDQTKRQAHIFLLGIERQIGATGSPLDPVQVRAVLQSAIEHKPDTLGFSVHELFAYGVDGKIVAFAGEMPPPARPLEGRYFDVLRRGTAYLGQETESVSDPPGHVVTDVIIPLHHDGRVVGGLEVEIDLERTIANIKRIDSAYEQEMTEAVTVAGALVLAFILWLIHARLIAPITRIGRMTSRIAAGDLGVRVHGLSRDEIGQLGDSINHMADNIEGLFNQQEQAYLQTLQALAKALEAKDDYTAKHSARVAKFSVLLGKHLGLHERELHLLRQGALMHDLGKIGIPDSILNKPAPLDDREYEVMRSHPELTATIMRPLKRFKEFTEIAAWHHERWDGNGYPDGLKGKAIPLLARIVSIADAWDAMTGDRVYRSGMAVDTALAILESERDSGQWDPHLIDVFAEMIRGNQDARHGMVDEVFSRQVELLKTDG